MRRLSDTSKISRGLSAATVAAFAAVLILLITDRVVSVHMMGVEITGLSCEGWCLVETDYAVGEASGDEISGG